MKKIELFLFILQAAFLGSCGGRNAPVAPVSIPDALATDQQIADYVVEIFEDSKGNLWFGTVEQGVARFDGKTLTYLTTADGLPGNTVADIVEDEAGNLWFGTHSGLSKYNGVFFMNFTEKDGLCNDRVSNLLLDKTGMLWVGTWDGVCRFDGRSFSGFDLPLPDVELLPYHSTMYWVTELMQDSRGNIWFGRDGYGACRFDGNAFAHFTKKEGLASNNVQVIREDGQGNIWFGSRVAENDHPDPGNRKGDGGLSRYDGKSLVQFRDIEGLSRNETYAIATDRAGNVWIGANNLGVYRYDGNSFHLFRGTDRMDLTSTIGVQSILEDKRGQLWFGLSGGLFRLQGGVVVHVPRGSFGYNSH